MRLSVGTYRALTQCSDRHGTLTILAIDHRSNLIAELEKHAGRPVAYVDVVAFKTSVIRHLAPEASAVLLDPDYGLPALAEGALPGQVGLLAPLEVTDYSRHASQRDITFIEGWDVAQLKRAGFSGAKLLLYYHPDDPAARRKTNLVDQVVAQCRAQQVPLFLEPVSFSPDPAQPLRGAARTQVIIDTARHFSARGVDVLKLEFPAEAEDTAVWGTALSALNAACSVPWTLLSAGMPFEVFLRQAQAACEAGASGVIAGRALWAEAVGLQAGAREQFLATTGRERMRQLAAVCRGVGRAWTERHMPPEIVEGWYRTSTGLSYERQ